MDLGMCSSQKWYFEHLNILNILDLVLNLWPQLTLSTTTPKFRHQVFVCYFFCKGRCMGSILSRSSEEGKGK